MSGRNIYDPAKYQAKRQWMFDFLGGQCVVCGSTQLLTIVYKDKTTAKFTVSRHWSAPKEKLKEELVKCHLMCRADYGISRRGEKMRPTTGDRKMVYKNFDLDDTEEL